MFQKPMRRSDDSADQTQEMLAVESSRSAAQSSHAKEEAKNSDEKMSLFWRVFGGTILSIIALTAITLFNHISNSLAELRADVAREREARSELVKKDEFQTRSTSQYERIRAAEGLKVDLETLKERAHANAAALDAVKKETAGLEVLKERLAGIESVKKEAAGIELLRERLAALSVDLKAAREDVLKLQAELEKNRAADMERKASRDSQAKQYDDALKELQKEVQLCREKLARFEGSQSPPKTAAPPKD